MDAKVPMSSRNDTISKKRGRKKLTIKPRTSVYNSARFFFLKITEIKFIYKIILVIL